ncbi:4-diphosphocytidyl-2C-methyl-D-erythritol kinase [candidate division KSB1 bacterium]|nr:4-diphosphocytidyl-2C-methyl-D-erythritol kinase [candidate division KSB1 bacterium]
MNQGAKGNKTGNLLEGTVRNILIEKGFEIVKHKDWLKNNLFLGKELLIENVPYTTIYNHNGKTEFLLKSEAYNFEARIECKWQQVAGSVDEKLPYLYLNCIEAMPEKNIIILIDGEGWKAGSIQWLKDAAKNAPYSTAKSKNIQVFSLTEFMTWANNFFV